MNLTLYADLALYPIFRKLVSLGVQNIESPQKTDRQTV